MQAQIQTEFSEVQNLLKAKSPEARSMIIKFAEAELERRKQENPLKYFIPNGAVERLINVVGDREDKWIFVLAAANSVGKTAATIAILGNLIWGPQSDWFNRRRFNNWKYPKKFWYISQHTTLKDFVCGMEEGGAGSEIAKWFIPGRYKFVKAGAEFNSYLQSDTGWTGRFKTYDMDTNKFESEKIGVAVFDEPPPKTIFNAVVARLTMGGIIIMPMTPLHDSAWVQDDLVDKAGVESHIYVFYAKMHENCKQCGIRGILEHDQLVKISDQYDPEEKDARMNGTFAHLSGLVYKGLHPDINRHVIDPVEFGQDRYKIYCVCDPHDAKPPMIGWFAVDKFINVWGIDEFPFVPEFLPFRDTKNWKLTTKNVVDWIRIIEVRNGWDPRKIIRVMDPNFGLKPIQAIGKNISETYRDFGKAIGWPTTFSTKVNDDLFAGHELVKNLVAINPDGGTRMRFGERQVNIWYSMTHYSRK